jgi:predicted ribosomally synthesized peptide with SipW-like signal peptide
MNKKLIISLGVIGIVAVTAIGATIAYYNDTETSTGNIFTAGTIDLKVDHLAQTYDGVDCKTCSITIKSDTSDMVISTVGGNDAVNLPHNAVLVTLNPAWPWAPISGANWIWATQPTSDYDAQNQVSYTFQKIFDWFNPAIGGTIDLNMAADNGYAVLFNGNQICSNPGEHNYENVVTCTINPGYINQGQNTLTITVTNKPIAGSDGAANPGGLIYKLTINGNCDNNGEFAENCRLWSEKDLGDGDTFFNFSDIKPGDWGTNLISLHVKSNDAWSCLFVDKVGDNDEEISEDLNVVVWQENGTANGTHEAGETILYKGPLADSNIPVADATHGIQITGGDTRYIGLAWCFGAQTADTNTVAITCSGAAVDDEAQGDTLSATLTAFAEQWRNNAGFDCTTFQQLVEQE